MQRKKQFVKFRMLQIEEDKHVYVIYIFVRLPFQSGVILVRFTVAHNCHIKTKCSQQITKRSHQIQIAHIKFKSLTSNSNRSQQIQITHSKLQIAHSKFKSPTANSNRSQQIKVAHSKFKLLTSNYKLLTPIGVFGYLQPAVQLV